MAIKRGKVQNSLTYQVSMHGVKHEHLIKFLDKQKIENNVSNSKLFLKAMQYFYDQYYLERNQDNDKDFREEVDGA